MSRLQISYLKLADHRNGKRLWIQGLRLDEAGYAIGCLYSMDVDDRNTRIHLTVSDEGTHRVSRKKVGERYYPLIDLVNRQLAELFTDVDRVQVVIEEGRITIEYHRFDRMRIEREARLADILRSGRPIPMASLAHGAGILDYYVHKGLEDEHIRSGLIWAVEPENTYLQTSWNNNPVWSYECEVIEGRIEDIETSELKSPLIVCAGLPCTGASLSGRSKNALKFAEQHETAGTAFIGFLMMIRQLSPAICILENVPQYSTTVSMHMIRQALTDWRYQIHEIVLDRELGAFEDRKRLCMVAVSEGIDFAFDLKPVRPRERTLGEILDEVPPESPKWRTCSYLDDKQERDLAAGKRFAMQLVDGNSVRIGTVGRSYCKWRSTEPLVANHPHDPALRRLLTVDELARAKAIDPDLVAGMSQTRQIEMMGQSVLGVAFQALGRNVGQCLKRQYLVQEVAA
jgi:DNA (cytosine-5)-methyltransferase 1